MGTRTTTNVGNASHAINMPFDDLIASMLAQAGAGASTPAGVTQFKLTKPGVAGGPILSVNINDGWIIEAIATESVSTVDSPVTF